MTPIVDNCRSQVIESLNFEDLQALEPRHIVIGLSPTRVALCCREVLEAVHSINCKTEENVIVHEYLSFLDLVRVQRCKIAFDDGHSTLRRCMKKIIINFLDSPISLRSLGHILPWEVVDNLILLVPVTNTFGIKAE